MVAHNRDDKDTLLLVDDQVSDIDVLVGALQAAYRLRVALAAKKALELAHMEPQPALILLDITMANGDGFQLCRELKSNPVTSEIPIIFVSANTDSQFEEQAFAVGASDFIRKPVSASILLARVRNQLAVAFQSVELRRKVDARTEELQLSKLKLIHRLSCAAEYRDDETAAHIARMSRYCRIIAEGYGASAEWCERIYQAAPLHDIGKIAMPDTILTKGGELDGQERMVMQRHTAIGADILGDDDEPLITMARSIALTHHERYDGSGYPNNTFGEDIPLEGRIAAIADTFDALQAPRPYRQSLSVEQASAYINEQSGVLFDPILVQVFNRVMPQLLRVRSQYRDDLDQGVDDA